jgi:hypothetical protein
MIIHEEIPVLKLSNNRGKNGELCIVILYNKTKKLPICFYVLNNVIR